jgi:hypothetical protein
MIGSHRNEILTPEEKIVDEFYAKVVKQYVRTGNPGSGIYLKNIFVEKLGTSID